MSVLRPSPIFSISSCPISFLKEQSMRPFYHSPEPVEDCVLFPEARSPLPAKRGSIKRGESSDECISRMYRPSSLSKPLAWPSCLDPVLVKARRVLSQAGGQSGCSTACHADLPVLPKLSNIEYIGNVSKAIFFRVKGSRDPMCGPFQASRHYG